jgi:hypothetical protein
VKSNTTGFVVMSVGTALGGSGAGITNEGALLFNLINMTFGSTLRSGVTPLISSGGTSLTLLSSLLRQTGESAVSIEFALILVSEGTVTLTNTTVGSVFF